MIIIFFLLLAFIYWQFKRLTRVPKCPKCGGKNIIVMRPGVGSYAARGLLFTLLPVIGMFVGAKATHYECREDGFQWAK